MKNSFVILYIIVCTLCASSGWSMPAGKTTLTGKVTDKASGEALPGVTLYVPDLKTGAVTNLDGVYKIENLPNSKILIQISFLGYTPILETVDLATITNKDFALEASVKEMSEVVVTGTSKATEIKRNPVPMMSVNKEFLTQNASTNIIETLNKVPGVSSLSTGPNVSKPYIRGLGSNRVLTMYDGVRQEGQQWGEEHGVEMDQFLIDHIEVLKGPASLMYGSDALAGVVNLLPANPVPEGTIKGNVLSNYQTNNKQIAGSIALDGNNKGFIWGFRASRKQASNYQNKVDGPVYGTKYQENDLNAYIGLQRSWGYTHLNFSVYDNLQEIPDGSRDSLTRKFTQQISELDTVRPIVSNQQLTSYSIAVLHQHVQHYRLYSASNFIFGRSKLNMNLGVQQSVRREYSHPTAPDLAGLSLLLNVYSYDFKLHLPDVNGLESTIGVNGMLQHNDASKGSEFVVPNYRSFDLGPFIHFKKTFGKLDVAAGIRYDVRWFQNDSMYTHINPSTGFEATTAYTGDSTSTKQFSYYKHIFAGLSGSIGATYNLNDKLSIKANVARGYRAPNVFEIAAKGVHPGTGIQQLGDDNFKPEFSLQEDIGLFLESKHISASIEVFENHISNYIYNEKLQTSQGSDSLFHQAGNTYPVFKFRQTSAALVGGELSFEIHPHPLDWLHFENSISIIYATNRGGNGAHITDSTKYLPFIPPLHTNSELRANLKTKFARVANAYLKIGVQYYAAQNRAYLASGTETKTPAYTLVEAGMGTDVLNKKGKTLINVSILGTNLADVAYQSNMSRLKYFDNYPINGSGRSGIYNIGRNISFKLVIPVGF